MISRAFRPFRALRASFRTLAFLVLAATATPAAQADAILHAFNWRYADVQARADQIRDAGYRIVLVSPAYKSEGNAWWARYQPQDFRLIHNPLGDTTAFRNMVTALQQRGIDLSQLLLECAGLVLAGGQSGGQLLLFLDLTGAHRSHVLLHAACEGLRPEACCNDDQCSHRQAGNDHFGREALRGCLEGRAVEVDLL